MGARGEYSRPGQRCLRRNLPLATSHPEVARFKDLRLAKDPGRARGVGQPSPAGRSGSRSPPRRVGS